MPSPSAPVPEGTLQARVEVLPPAGHATALRATFWSNGVPVAVGGLVMQPGLGGPEVVPVTWHLRSTLQPGVWELSEPVAGADTRPSGSMRLVLPTEVTLRPATSLGIVQPGSGERLRRWLFLSEDLQSSSTAPTWGVSVDIEPQAVSKVPSPSAAAGKIATNVVGYVTSGGQTQVVADPAEAEALLQKQGLPIPPSPSEGAGKIATNVVGYVTSGGQTQVVVDTSEAEAVWQKQAIQVELALDRYIEARARMAVGAITPLEFAAAGRDLEVAQACGDAVAIAEAVTKYSRLVLETTRKMHEVGKAAELDLRGAQATNNIAEIELTEARRKSALTPSIAAVAALRADLDMSDPNANRIFQQRFAELKRHTDARRIATERLHLLRKQADVGLIAPRGLEILDAELAVAVAEADLANEKITRAAAVRDHAEKTAETTMQMNRVGKATDEQLKRALAGLAKASTALASSLELASDRDMEQLRGVVAHWLGTPAPAAVRDVRFFSDEGTAAEPRYLLRFHAGPDQMEAMLRREGFTEATATFGRDNGPAWWRSAPSGGLAAYSRDRKPAGCVVETLWWSREAGDVFYLRSCP
jgi:hypothetical protein